MFFPTRFPVKNRLKRMEKTYRRESRKQERAVECEKGAALAYLKKTRNLPLT